MILLWRHQLPPKVVYTNPTYHDPTGVVLSLERRKALLDWAYTHKTLIIEDAFDSDYRYFGRPVASLQSLDERGVVLYIYTFWKTLYPLSTVGVLVVPPQLVPIFERVKLLAERQLPSLEHLALADFIRDGRLERHVKRARDVYAKRRQALIHALTLEFRSEIRIRKQSAALHACVQLLNSTSKTTEEILRLGQQAGLLIASTERYYVEDPPLNEFLIAFAPMSDDAIAKAVAAWSKAVLSGE